MSLFPNEDIRMKEIESWKGFGDSLSSEEDRELFKTMLNEFHCVVLQTPVRHKQFKQTMKGFITRTLSHSQ
jgi:menaquinone-dependent protoporphyrinogen IX oxidase